MPAMTRRKRCAVSIATPSMRRWRAVRRCISATAWARLSPGGRLPFALSIIAIRTNRCIDEAPRRSGRLLVLTTMSRLAHAGGRDIRTCDFEVKTGSVSGDACFTLAEGAGLRAKSMCCGAVCGVEHGVTHGRSIHPAMKVKVGLDVSIDLSET